MAIAATGPKDIESIRKFKLSNSFVNSYENKKVNWGPIGYVVFKRNYSRIIEESNRTEEWFETCRRVIEGMFTIQKRHVHSLGLPWINEKAQRTAKEAYDRMFQMKWMPGGRGLWMMGTDYLEKKSGAGLFSCAFRTTEDIEQNGPYIFKWIMDAFMYGVGVGFDTKGANKLTIRQPTYSEEIYSIQDSKEGWCDSLEILLNGFFNGGTIPKFDYSKIRPKGSLINGFGGVCPGYEPLEHLHIKVTELLSKKIDHKISSVDIVDIENYIGKCVISGNVRKSAAIAIGEYNDYDFLEMKNDYDALIDRRMFSNNSFFSKIGMDYSYHANQTAKNGEPGYIWLDNAKEYGRMKDGRVFSDMGVVGCNPCAEIPLENGELCNLVENFPAMHSSFDDFKRTLKFSYLYGKTATLINTHWPETNAVMLKNRRVGLSVSGIIQAFEKHGKREIYNWLDKGYEYLRDLDKSYSNWLCVQNSIKITTCKPSGNCSLLNGSTSGVHYPESEYYIRRVRFEKDSEILRKLNEEGYKNEPAIGEDTSYVVEFPIHEKYFKKGKADITIWEQLENVAQLQYYWADNSVSVTITFKEDEKDQIKDALSLYETRLKVVSFLKYDSKCYEQMPLESITKEQYNEMVKNLKPIEEINFKTISQEGIGEKYCSNDSCQLNY